MEHLPPEPVIGLRVSGLDDAADDTTAIDRTRETSPVVRREDAERFVEECAATIPSSRPACGSWSASLKASVD